MGSNQRSKQVQVGLATDDQILILSQGLESAQRTIDELAAQRDEALRLLDIMRTRLHEFNALSPLMTNTGGHVSKPMTTSLPAAEASSNWILGSWCACDGALAEAEYLCRRKNWQQALAQLDYTLARNLDEAEVVVNCKLLKARVLGELHLLQDAIACCEDALQYATTRHVYHLRGKSQFHLGILYYEDGRLSDARAAFGMATYTIGHREQVDVWKELCDGHLRRQNKSSCAMFHVSHRESDRTSIP